MRYFCNSVFEWKSLSKLDLLTSSETCQRLATATINVALGAKALVEKIAIAKIYQNLISASLY